MTNTFEGHDPLAFIAVVVGPLMMAAGLLFIGIEFHRSARDLHDHIKRIAERDVYWQPIIEDVRNNTSKISDSLGSEINKISDQQKSITRTLEQIINDQKELIAVVQGKKISEMMSSKKKHGNFVGDEFGVSEFNPIR